MRHMLKGGSWYSISITRLFYFTWEGALDKKTSKVKGFRIIKPIKNESSI